VQAQRDVILDPNDPEVIAEARKCGIEEPWLEACRRSPVYKMVKEWRIALPLHSEFRTMPSLFYVPPESPVQTAGDGSGHARMVGGDEEGRHLPNLDDFRVPIKYLASLLAAGNEQEVKSALTRLLALRSYRRSIRVYNQPDLAVLKLAGLTESQAVEMHRLLALAHYHERFVVPTTHREATAGAPYIERGYAGYDEMSPGTQPHRRQTFHGAGQEVGS